MIGGQRLRQRAGCVFSIALVLWVGGASLLYGQTRRSPVVIAIEKASPAVVSILSAQTGERAVNPFAPTFRTRSAAATRAMSPATPTTATQKTSRCSAR